MTYISPYEESVSAAIAEINKLFAEKLGLESDLYTGDMSTDKKFGFISPRDLVPPKDKVYGGISSYTWNLDVLCQFSIDKQTNLQQASAQMLLRVQGVLDEINAVKSVGNRCGALEPKKLSTVPKQNFKEPHDVIISIVGSATLEQFIYHNGCGQPVFNLC